MKLKFTAVAVAVSSLLAATAFAQTYKTDFSTQIMLAGGGNDPIHALTLNAPALESGYTLSFPNVAPSAGSILQWDGTANQFKWVDISTIGITSIAGTSPIHAVTTGGATTISITAGSHNSFLTTDNTGTVAFTGLQVSTGLSGDGITTALTNTGVLSVSGSGPISVSSGQNPQVSLSTGNLTSDGSVTIGSGAGSVVGSGTTADLNMGHTNDWTITQTFSGGLTGTTASFSGSTSLDAAAAGSGGTITIGNSGLNNGTPDSSVTTINGAVNFTGPVNIPASDLNLGLADDNFFIGGSDGNAHAKTITQDVSITNGGVATVNSASGTAFSVTNNISVGGGAKITGADTVIGTLYANGNANIDAAAPGSGGTITIGNSGLNNGTPDSSVTTINGAVNLTGAVTFTTGPVSFPLGTITAGSLSLAANDILFGNALGHADSATVTQDLTLENNGANNVQATVNGSHATTFAVANAETVGGTLGVTGQTTLASTALSQSTLQNVTAGGDVELGTAKSYFQLTSTSDATISSIDNATPPPAGDLIVLANTGAHNITLQHAGNLALNSADVLMAPNGTVTLMYNGTNWILVGSE